MSRSTYLINARSLLLGNSQELARGIPRTTLSINKELQTISCSLQWPTSSIKRLLYRITSSSRLTLNFLQTGLQLSVINADR